MRWKKIIFVFLLAVQGVCLHAAPPKYIWNLGLAMLCDVSPLRNGLPREYHTVPSPDYTNPQRYIIYVKEGDVIWLQSHQVAHFYHNVFPYIRPRFILVINDGDASFPSSYREFCNVDAMIQDPRVIHVFAQNVDSPGYLNKVSGIPIGIDFHTVANSHYCRVFGESQQSVERQEESLDALLSTLSPTHQRKKRAFVDFQLTNQGTFDGESRTSIFNQIYPTGPIDVLQQRIPRHELWETKGQYAFSISPRGAGLDCHRTWEDLTLGCIVIVKTSPLDPLYEGLPVVIVKDWSEITEENFDKWLIQYGDAFTNPAYRERLTTAYWANVIRSKKNG